MAAKKTKTFPVEVWQHNGREAVKVGTFPMTVRRMPTLIEGPGGTVEPSEAEVVEVEDRLYEVVRNGSGEPSVTLSAQAHQHAA